MANSYQNEIPKARVNITLDVETQGGLQKKELPMKLLVMGDFSNGQSTDALADRKPVKIDKNNFEQVMSSHAPTAKFTVPNRLGHGGEEIACELTFNQMNDFSPERVAEAVPALNRLLAMRNLLKDLKASVLDNQTFRKELEKVLQDQQKTAALGEELSQRLSLAAAKE